MANQYDMHVLEEGWRNARVKITGVLDTSDASITPAISVQDFSNNDKQMSALTGFRIDKVEWAISDGIEVLLTWNSAAVPQQMIYPLSGRGKQCPEEFGGLLPNTTLTGYDGSINLVTNGFNSTIAQQGGTRVFAVELNLVKMYKV